MRAIAPATGMIDVLGNHLKTPARKKLAGPLGAGGRHIDERRRAGTIRANGRYDFSRHRPERAGARRRHRHSRRTGATTATPASGANSAPDGGCG